MIAGPVALLSHIQVLYASAAFLVESSVPSSRSARWREAYRLAATIYFHDDLGKWADTWSNSQRVRPRATDLALCVPLVPAVAEPADAPEDADFVRPPPIEVRNAVVDEVHRMEHLEPVAWAQGRRYGSGLAYQIETRLRVVRPLDFMAMLNASLR